MYRVPKLEAFMKSMSERNFIYFQTRNFAFKIIQVLQIYQPQEYISCPVHSSLSQFETVFLVQKNKT